ncbi:hypothetical protein [Chitinophaga arvensicola]|uniref:Uncharacterized protein n=1 Tax=Chitinophaga arvensicola TaxID=29529 RepID=A0A1I0RI80_9BACT|nr:hypothetical protein [Chitinophaga arvensicola]SEW40568.1 hypothetical protein SAMN04488122_2868 [Chitinophaga arvensicola]
MKRIISIWLLGIMLLQGTGNCWIVGAFYLNRDYIASQLCINRFDLIPVCKGSCFLDRKINENEKRQEKTPDIKLKEITLFCMAYEYTPAAQVSTGNHIAFCDYQSPYSPRQWCGQLFRPPSATA